MVDSTSIANSNYYSFESFFYIVVWVILAVFTFIIISNRKKSKVKNDEADTIIEKGIIKNTNIENESVILKQKTESCIDVKAKEPLEKEIIKKVQEVDVLKRGETNDGISNITQQDYSEKDGIDESGIEAEEGEEIASRFIKGNKKLRINYTPNSKFKQ